LQKEAYKEDAYMQDKRKKAYFIDILEILETYCCFDFLWQQPDQLYQTVKS